MVRPKVFVEVLVLCAVFSPAYGRQKQNKSEQDAARILGAAEALTQNLKGIDKAYAYFLVARAYSNFNPGEERRILQESCESAVRAPADEMDASFKEKIEYDCLQRLLAVKPEPAKELLSQASANVRQQILAGGAVAAAKKGDINAALNLLSSEISQGAEYPYDRALVVLKELPSDDRNDRDRIFAQALSIYRERHGRPSAGMEDLGTIIVSFWRDLSPGLVLEGMNELLDSAREESVGESHLEISVSSRSSIQSFGSLYEYRLFQLLPVLTTLDPAGAEKLVSENPQLETAQKSMKSDPMLSLTLQRKDGPAGANHGPTDDLLAVQLRKRAGEILASSKDDPDLAIARALALGDTLDQNRSVKADLLIGIARATAKEHVEIGAQALDELMKSIENYPALARSRYLAEAGDLYWRVRKIEKVKSIVAQGMKVVNELYKADTNSDDPNRALKSAWPSTVVSRAFALLASRVSLQFAEETLHAVPDPDLQVFDRIEIASSLLAVSSYPSLTEQRHKQKDAYSVQVFPISFSFE